MNIPSRKLAKSASSTVMATIALLRKKQGIGTKGLAA